MPFIYDNLWNVLAEKNMSKEELRMKIKASQTTIVNLGRNKNVSLDVIDRICKVLDCNPTDIMSFVPEIKPERPNYIPKLGDVCLAKFKVNDGSYDQDIHTVIVLQATKWSTFFPSVLVVPCSPRIPKEVLPPNFKIDDAREIGFRLPKYVVQMEHITSIKITDIKNYLFQIKPNILERIQKDIGRLLGFRYMQEYTDDLDEEQ